MKKDRLIEKDILIEYYLNQNLTIKEVAKQLQVSVDRVVKSLNFFNIKKDNTLVHHDRKIISKEEIIELYINQNLSLKETAKRLGVGHSTLSMRLREFNIHKSREQTLERTKETVKERYGVEHVLQNKEILDKVLNTTLSRYGETNYAKTDEYRKKVKQTCLEKYGVDCVLKLPEIQERIKNTCLKQYGVESPLESVEIQEKIRESNLQKYGVESPMLCPQIQDRVKTAWKNKTEQEIEDIQNKRKNTNLQKYGVEYTIASPEVREKVKNTMLSRYGKEYASQVEEFREKVRQTCLDKFNVPYACQRPEARIGHHSDSKTNKQFENKLKTVDINYTREFNIDSFSYDFKLDDKLIEINPSATHNIDWSPFGDHTSRIDKNYHLDKSKTAEENNYRCIHVFDWDNEEAIMSMLKHKEKIYARKCQIKEVDAKEAKCFIDKYHIQYNAVASVYIGLFYVDELVSIMSFHKPRYNKHYEWELIRYCYSLEVVGGAEKLFKYFIDKYSPKSIISYCDLSKFSGILYDKLGFKLLKKSKPCCHWYNIKTKQHITDNLLRQRGFDQLFGTNYGKKTSNILLMLESGFVRVYDCGQATYVWKLEES